MFSREESKKLREEFWIAFGKSFPRKWILYRTKIKGLSMKFHFDTRKAQVALLVDHADLEQRIELWEKIQSLQNIIVGEYWPDAIFEDSYLEANGKEVSKVYVALQEVSIHNKNSWQETMEFLYQYMDALETFFLEYRDILNPTA